MGSSILSIPSLSILIPKSKIFVKTIENKKKNKKIFFSIKFFSDKNYLYIFQSKNFFDNFFIKSIKKNKIDFIIIIIFKIIPKLI